MAHLARRSWPPEICEAYVQKIADETASAGSEAIHARIDDLIAENRRIHERDCFNLNPATNVMNPRAEALLASGIGTRPSLGYPGDKYEMGLEAIEKIEVIAAELAAEVFGAAPFEKPRTIRLMNNKVQVIAFERPATSERLYVIWNRTFDPVTFEMPASSASAKLYTRRSRRTIPVWPS